MANIQRQPLSTPFVLLCFYYLYIFKLLVYCFREYVCMCGVVSVQHTQECIGACVPEACANQSKTDISVLLS